MIGTLLTLYIRTRIDAAIGRMREAIFHKMDEDYVCRVEFREGLQRIHAQLARMQSPELVDRLTVLLPHLQILVDQTLRARRAEEDH